MFARLAANATKAYEKLEQQGYPDTTDANEMMVYEDQLSEAKAKADYWKQLAAKPENAKPEEQVVQETAKPAEAVAEEPKPAAEQEPDTPPTPPAEPAKPVEPAQPAGPTAEQKIAQGTVKNNIGKRFGFRNPDGTRSEIVIDNFKGDDLVTVTRQDYDMNGQPKGNVYQQDLKLTDVGNSIVNGLIKPALSTDEKLRKVFKVTVGDIPLADVLTEAEQQQLLDLIAKKDNEAVGSLTGDLIDAHHEDLILRGRDMRNAKVDQIMNSNASREQKLRKIRELYKGYPDAEVMLEDETLKPGTLEEYVSDLHSRVPKSGEGPIAYFSYEKDSTPITGMQDETGFGNKNSGDSNAFKPWLAPKGKGMSLMKYAEQVHSQLPEPVQEQYDVNQVRNTILDVFGGAERPSDITTMVIRRGILQAENAARRMEEMWIDGGPNFHKVSADDSSFTGRLERAKQQTNTEPTEAQKEKGNYKKGHVSFGGYDFVVENPEGSIRRGTDADGRQWEQKMNNTYGYILGRYGKDGDHLDMFINDQADLDNWNGKVYVIDQVDPKTGSFDEHKIVYGYDSEAEARDAYLSNYEKGWKGLGKITGIDKETFDSWLDSSKRKRIPFAEHSIPKEALSKQQAQQPVTEAEIDKALMKEVMKAPAEKGVQFVTDVEEGQRVLDEANGNATLSRSKKRAIETASLNPKEGSPADISTADGAKIQKKLESYANKLEKVSNLRKNFLDELAVELGATSDGSKSKYATFITKNGDKVTVRLGNHNATVSTFDYRGEDNGISIVVSRRENDGVTNDGNAHIVEAFYPEIALRKAYGKPLAEIVRSINEALDSGKYNDITGLAEMEEVNADEIKQQKVEAPIFNSNALQAVEGIKQEKGMQGQPMFFKTPDGQAYGFTYKGKIYVDPRIATSETPIHEYGHLWAEMKRQSSPVEWYSIKQALLGDKLIEPIIEKVRREYPELTGEGKEDDFVEEVLTQFSGKHGAEKLRKMAQEIKEELGNDATAATIAEVAVRRVKSILNEFWKGVCDLMGWRYSNAEDVADAVLRDMLNGVNPRERMKEASPQVKSQQEIERTLMGVHNISEDKLRKVLKQGGLANPSLAVIDTKNHMHTDYGEISLIPRSSLIDAKSGRNAGTWTADAWTPTYPQVTKRMSSKGQDKYWAETRKSLGDEPDDIRSKTMMAFESWMENGASPERLSYWYLKERGINPEQVMYEPSMTKEDIAAYRQAMGKHDRFSELDEAGRKAVLALIAKDRGETPDEMAAKMQELKERNTQRMNDENSKALVKMRAERIIGEIDEYGVPYSYISDYDYKVRNAEKTDGKLNVDSTLSKAAEQVKSEGLEEDFGKWLDEKEKSYGIEEWLYNGTDNEGRQKWVRNTLENASRLMRNQGRNGAHGMATGNLIATVAKRVTTLDQIRKERGNLNTTLEEHEAFKEKWGDALLELCHKCGDELWVGEARLQEALGEKNPVGHLKKEYGVELSKEDAELLNTFIKEVRENFPTGYFETKFERPVMLDEFSIAVVPETASPEIVKALKDAGLDVRTYDNTGSLEQQHENRRQATMDAVQGRDDIMFQKKRREEKEKRDAANRTIDEATAFVTGKDLKTVRAERKAREQDRKRQAEEIYQKVLSGEINDVTLQQINDYIDNVTPNNPYGRRLSERLPQRVERSMREGERTNKVDALYSRISESAVRPNGRTRSEGRRAIEERKKELLEQWAKATGNWHTDLSDFTDSNEPIKSGTDSDVYVSKDGNYVIKMSKGKPEGKRFRPDIDNIPLFNYLFPNSHYEILGYGDFGNGFVRILKQPVVDFENSKPLTEEERVEYMDKLGFHPINDKKTAFSNGEIIVADLQKSNIVKDAAGNTSCIPATLAANTTIHL